MKTYGVIALTVGVALIAVFSLFGQQRSPQTPAASGRYQVVPSTLPNAGAFLVDTQTGMVWQFIPARTDTTGGVRTSNASMFIPVLVGQATQQSRP